MQAAPIYSMFVHQLPMNTCNRIDKIIREFWWGDNLEKRKLHSIAWDKIRQIRGKGRLGIR